MSNPLWNKKLKCPFCGGEFETTRMRSSAIKTQDKQTDFAGIFEGECPYLYAITVCPHCTFAAQNKDFDTIRAGAEPKILEATRLIKKSGKKLPDIFGLGPSTPEVAAKRYEMAIAFAKLRAYKEAGTLPNLYLHLTWIYRMAKDVEKEGAFMALAAKAYEEYLHTGSDTPEALGEPGVLYLIGELHRRLGSYQEAHRYFERALGSREIKAYPRIADMIRDMMIITRDQMK